MAGDERNAIIKNNRPMKLYEIMINLSLKHHFIYFIPPLHGPKLSKPMRVKGAPYSDLEFSLDFQGKKSTQINKLTRGGINFIIKKYFS